MEEFEKSLLEEYSANGYKGLGEYLRQFVGNVKPIEVMTLLNENQSRGENRVSFIILYKKNGMRYIINRSCYLGSISIPWEVVANYMMTTPENIRYMIHQAQQDTTMEILEVVDVSNIKRCDQTYLNEIKLKWAEKKDAIVIKDVKAKNKEFTNIINNKAFNYNGLIEYLEQLRNCINSFYKGIQDEVVWEFLKSRENKESMSPIMAAYRLFQQCYKENKYSRYVIAEKFNDKQYRSLAWIILSLYDQFYYRTTKINKDGKVGEFFPFESRSYYHIAKLCVENELMKLDIIISIVKGERKVKHIDIQKII